MEFYVFNTSSDTVSLNYSLSLGLLNTKRKPLVKKQLTGRSAGVDFEFYQSGRENSNWFHLCCTEYPLVRAQYDVILAVTGAR